MAWNIFSKAKQSLTGASAPEENKEKQNDNLPSELASALPEQLRTVPGIIQHAAVMGNQVSAFFGLLIAYCNSHEKEANKTGRRDQFLSITTALAPYADRAEFLALIKGYQHDLAWAFINANPSFVLTEPDMALVNNPPARSKLYSGLIQQKARERIQPAN